MNTNRLSGLKISLFIGILSVVMGCLPWMGVTCRGQNAPQNLPPGVGEVVKLAQAHMTDDVILAYIRNSNVACALTADQIIYLHGQGVSQNAISAMMRNPGAMPASANPSGISPGPGVPQAAPLTVAPAQVATPVPTAPVAAPVVAAAPTAVAEANFEAFRAQLAPYGAWIQVEGYGWCWRPAEVTVNPDWRPYGDRGHWVYTDDGWYWQSEYAWGDTAFHYGRWARDARFGWLWIPDYTWAPAWVCWRHSEGYCGWAPLPPAARFEAGVGLVFNGRGGVGVELDFGLRDEHFIFVGYDHFWEHDFHRFMLPRERVAIVFRGSHVMNNYRVVNHHLAVEGIGRARMATLTHRNVEVVVTPHARFAEHHAAEVRHDARPGAGPERSPRDTRPQAGPKVGERGRLDDRREGRH